ncbi:MAG: hypothetical protein JO131_00150, partial [Gammaproteobacteria bacterium]|nr:hypothetical protein [Gammaproteobacteria bacterium]
MHRKSALINNEPFFAQSDKIYFQNEILLHKNQRTEDELKTTNNVLLERIQLLEKSKHFFSTTFSEKFGPSKTNIDIINNALENSFYDLAGIFFEKLQFALDTETKIHFLKERIHFLEKAYKLCGKAGLNIIIKEMAESNENLGDLYNDENKLDLAKDAYTRAINYLKKSSLSDEEEALWQVDVYLSLLNINYNLKLETQLESNDKLWLKNLVDSLPTSKKSEKLSELNEYPAIRELLVTTSISANNDRNVLKSLVPISTPVLEKNQLSSVAKMKKIIDSNYLASKKRKKPIRNKIKKIPKKKQEKPFPIEALSIPDKYHRLDCLLHLSELKKVGSALEMEPMKPSKDINGIRLVHVNTNIQKPNKIIAYEIDNVIFDKAASFETLSYQFICIEKIKEVANYACENNILFVLLTHRPESDYFYNRSPFACHKIANEIFGANSVNCLIYTDNLPN